MTALYQPLTGVRVLDLTRFPPGGYCTVMLSDLGADVGRVVSPNPGASGFSTVALDRGKRSVAVDLRHARGNEVLRRLAEWADVLVENERPHAMDERGFGFTHASVEMPSLIWCSITGYGQDGPYAPSGAGHDLSFVAHSGLLAAINPNFPWHPQTILAIPVGAVMAVVGILAALRERDRTGQGCQLDISMSESATWLLSGTDGEINGGGWGIPVSPDRHLYECADGGWVAVAAAEPRTWRALCEALGFDDLVDTLHRWNDPASVTDRLASAFRTRPAADWVAELAPLGTSVVRANRGTELQDDPHLQARGTLQRVGDVLVPRNPIRVRDADGERPPTAAVAPPAPGADTHALLAEAGLSPGEIDDLRASGVLGSA